MILLCEKKNRDMTLDSTGCLDKSHLYQVQQLGSGNKNSIYFLIGKLIFSDATYKPLKTDLSLIKTLYRHSFSFHLFRLSNTVCL